MEDTVKYIQEVIPKTITPPVYRYLKLSDKKNSLIVSGYTWQNIGNILEVRDWDYKHGVIPIFLNNRVLIEVKKEDYDAQFKS